jgi:DNA-binding transcriptional LysR family regulator
MAKRLHKLSLDNLRVLDAIDRHGSFAAAAQELCVVTSSVTHVIRNIEQNLGLTLFDRSGRSARFTGDGRQLLDKGRVLLQRAAEFDEEVQLLATGWETSLIISLDQVIRMEPLVPLFEDFCKEAAGTSLHVRREAVAGTWDALLSGRADLVVGAPAGGPPGGGYETLPLFRIKFVFAVAPAHPLARLKGVIPNSEIARHRSVIVGDTTRSLPRLPRGLTDSRNCLSVPDAETKLDAILTGIGCGFLPSRLAEPHVKVGRLVSLKAETPCPPSQATLAWRAGENGRALRWWIGQLTRPGLAERLFF